MGEGKRHDGPAMYDVRGNDELHIKAIQIYPVSLFFTNYYIFIFVYFVVFRLMLFFLFSCLLVLFVC